MPNEAIFEIVTSDDGNSISITLKEGLDKELAGTIKIQVIETSAADITDTYITGIEVSILDECSLCSISKGRLDQVSKLD